MTLLFPHEYPPGNQCDAAKRPDNNPARLPKWKRPGEAWPFYSRFHAAARFGYFAAVGSGAGLSDSELR